jgi:hypothetical protein
MASFLPLTRIPDEFKPAILPSIPKLAGLLTDSDEWVRLTGANTMAKLLETGNREIISGQVWLRSQGFQTSSGPQSSIPFRNWSLF